MRCRSLTVNQRVIESNVTFLAGSISVSRAIAMDYFRRFRMEINLPKASLPEPLVPDGYKFLGWHDGLVERHAAVKYQSFYREIDSRIFQCLSETDGCLRLMSEIAGQRSFLPAATWLLVNDSATDGVVDCATIQGLAHSRVMGAIQNVGVISEHRGLGLGRALMLRSLAGFRRAGLKRVYLEVTADNRPAIELYRDLGFRLTRTMYKAVEPEFVPA